MAQAAIAEAPAKPNSATAACTLPYPDRWQAANSFVAHPPPGACVLSDERKLVLYALHQQATSGACKEPKPWGWNVTESAKHDAWSHLGDMSTMEAMRLYVKALEEDQPDWWTLTNQRVSTPDKEAAQPGAIPTAEAASAQPARQSNGAAAVDNPGGWSNVEPRGKKPPPRYEHAVAFLGGSIFVVGGNCRGRYLGDVWALHLDPWTWEAVSTSSLQPPQPAAFEPGKQERPHYLPPCAGHALVPWGSSLLCIGGHTKAKDKAARLEVWVLDKGSLTWSKLRITGQPPPLRGAHTATLIGSRIYIFGGEDFARRPQNDLFILDMADTAWRSPAESAPAESSSSATESSPLLAESSSQGPSARSAHVAACVGGRFLLIFGGGSVAHCHNDLWCLDTYTLQWSQPPTAGTPPCPRAGHASDVLDGQWYIAGGGNNASGCTDLVSLDISTLGSGSSASTSTPLQWHTVTQAPARDPVASEGLSLVAVPSSGVLVGFGGYNGRYHNSVSFITPAAAHTDAAKRTLPASTSAKTLGGSPAAPTQPSAQPFAPAAKQTADAAAANATANGNAEPASNGAYTPAQAGSHREPPTAPTSKPTGNRRSLTAEESRALGLAAELEAARAEAVSAKESAAMELAVMRQQLAKTQQALAQAEQARDQASTALAEAQGKVFKLEVQVAEGQKQAAHIAELEKEVSRYRKLAKEQEQGDKRRSSTGIWGYISGAPGPQGD